VYSTTLYRKEGNRVKNKQGTFVSTRTTINSNNSWI